MSGPAGEKVLIEERRGHWVECAYTGVKCSICGEWSPVVKNVCPNKECGAKLSGITYINWPRGKRGAKRRLRDGQSIIYV